MLVNLANGTTLSMRGGENNVYEIYAIEVDRTAADTMTKELIQEVNQMLTGMEKVTCLNDWICDRVIYNPKPFVSVNEIAASHTPVEGNCASFASMMNYLCGRAGIPCIAVYGESHKWNAIYVDGNWSYIDSSLNDQVSNHDAMLFATTARKQINDPEGLRFLQELLVPGSTE